MCLYTLNALGSPAARLLLLPSAVALVFVYPLAMAGWSLFMRAVVEQFFFVYTLQYGKQFLLGYVEDRVLLFQK